MIEDRPKITGEGLMEQIERYSKFPAPSNESILKQINNGTPGKHSKEFLVEIENEWFKNTGIIEDTDQFPALLKENGSLELVKDIKVDNDEVIDTQFYGDIMDDINIQEQEQYVQLMNTFLTRADKRKLKRYKGFKSFTDTIYGR